MQFIGNKKIVSTLSRCLEAGNLSHAYIFSGPESVGKFTLAKMLALSAIAEEGLNLDVDYCDKDALLDLIVVAPETTEKNKVIKQRDISIETIREAKLSLSLFPYQGKYKILIVNQAHRLNTSAMSALLKILEEPNATTIIILVTHELDRILPTILSRCQVVNFSLVSENEMSGQLGDAAALAMGRPGLAAELVKNNERKIFILETRKQFEKIMASSLNERFALADECSKNITQTLEKINIWIWELRRLSLEIEENRRLEVFSKIEKIQKAANILKRTNANSKLILETLFMDL